MKKKPRKRPEPLPWRQCLILGGAAFLLYLPTAFFGFTFDDTTIVQENPVVQSWGNWSGIFLSAYWPDTRSGLYRPVTIFSFSLERALHGSEPWGFHLTNAFLHAGVSVLVFLLALGMTGAGWPALVAGLLFAVHPIHTEAVASVVGRAELLAAGFSLLAVLAWIRRGRAQGSPWKGTASLVVLFLLAAASKENALVLPALLILWEIARRGEPMPGRVLLRLLRSRRLWCLVAAAVAFLLWRGWVLGGLEASVTSRAPFIENPLAHESAPSRIWNAAANQARSLALHVYPSPLLADYSHETLPIRDTPLNPETLLWASFCLACVILWLLPPRRFGLPAWALSWYLVSILPTSNILFPIGTVFAERLFYLPSVGLCLAAGIALKELSGALAEGTTIPASTSARAALVAALVSLLLLAGLTLRRNEVWKDDLSLFRDAVAGAPRNVKARLWLGDALVRAGSLHEGLEQYRTALEIHPEYGPASANMMVPLMSLRRPREAIEAGEKAKELLPKANATLLYNLALAYKEAGETVGFIDYMSRVLRLDPGNSPAHAQLGMYYWNEGGDRDRARAHFDEALRLDPGSPESRAIRSLLGRAR